MAGSQSMLPDEANKYFELHPDLAEKLRKAERAYKLFAEYLNLTQPHVVVRESGASTAEADISATLLRTDR